MTTQNLRVLSVEEQETLSQQWDLSKEKELLDEKRKHLLEKIELKKFAAYSTRA